jgi:transposase
MPSPVALEIVLSAEERELLAALARRRKTRNAVAVRARIVLAAADGKSNRQIADRLGIHRNTVSRWRRKFAERGPEGLQDQPRPGQPRTLTDEQVQAVVTKTLTSRPANAARWSTRSLAAEVGLTQTAVARIWRAHGLHPRRRTR